jgi:uncharacterized protein
MMDDNSISRRAMLAMLGAVTAGGAMPAFAADEPMVLKWADLMPPMAPRKPKSFLSGRAPDDPTQRPQNEVGPDARWMSGGKTHMSEPVPVVEALNGKRVSIGGYIVPLDFDATSVKEFLLVPFVGACIHVPPPPANQIVYVQSAKGAVVKGMFAPVTVIGKLTTTPSFTGLADTGYTLEAERVEAL